MLTSAWLDHNSKMLVKGSILLLKTMFWQDSFSKPCEMMLAKDDADKNVTSLALVLPLVFDPTRF